MKYAIIIPDGVLGEPLEALGGKTPLQAADLPKLDELAVCGRLGTAATVATGQVPTEAAAHLSALGYAPEQYPAGEGALTAHARGIEIGSDDQGFCCNLVTVIDGGLCDFTAGFIGSAEANPLIDTLNATFGKEGFHFHACGGYRNLCIWENAGPLPRLQTTPPDQVMNQPIKRHMPTNGAARPLYELMLSAHALLREHDVNLVRRDLGENPATAIWLWGHGPLPSLPSFQARFGVRGALVTGSDVVRGIGRLIGWDVLDVAGVTGQPDTNYAAKGQAALTALESFDLVCVHVRAPYVLSALGHVADATRALEAIDRHVVGPMLERLQAEPDWRMLVISPRGAYAAPRPESARRTLFVLAGSGMESNRGEAFDEDNAAMGEMHPDRASDLIEYFLRR